MTILYVVGGCKHLQVACALAKDKGLNIDKERKLLAHNMYQQGNYVQCGKSLLITSEHISSVYDLSCNKCSCVASSHGIPCIRSFLAEHFKIVDESELEQHDNVAMSQNSKKTLQSVQEMLTDLNAWANSPDYRQIPRVDQLVQRTHTLVFGQMTGSSCRKRKLTPLHPYRKEMERKLKGYSAMGTTDHQYNKREGVTKRRGSKIKTPLDYKVKRAGLSLKRKHRVMGVTQIYKNNH